MGWENTAHFENANTGMNSIKLSVYISKYIDSTQYEFMDILFCRFLEPKIVIKTKVTKQKPSTTLKENKDKI